MGEHIPPLRSRKGNLIFTDDGSVWCNYLLTGMNVNSYRPASALAAQDSHELLLTALSEIPTDDIMLTGLRVRIDPLDTARRITGGIPDWDPQHYRHRLERHRGVRTALSGGHPSGVPPAAHHPVLG